MTEREVMTKRFCDKCKKECKNPKVVRFSCGSNIGLICNNYSEVSIELCDDCQKETGVFEFIESQSPKEKPLEQTAQDKFFELFRELVCTTVQDIN